MVWAIRMGCSRWPANGGDRTTAVWGGSSYTLTRWSSCSRAHRATALRYGWAGGWSAYPPSQPQSERPSRLHPRSQAHLSGVGLHLPVPTLLRSQHTPTRPLPEELMTGLEDAHHLSEVGGEGPTFMEGLHPTPTIRVPRRGVEVGEHLESEGGNGKGETTSLKERRIY